MQAAPERNHVHPASVTQKVTLLQVRALAVCKLWDSTADSSEAYTDDILTRVFPLAEAHPFC